MYKITSAINRASLIAEVIIRRWSSMKRVGFKLKVKQDRIEEHKQQHENV
jgi:hypothetical protein